MPFNQLILNNPQKNLSVLSLLKDELEKCDEFFMSVAFITGSGITPFLQILKEINSKGKILTTDYNYFTEPSAIESLLKLDNVEVRFYKSNEENVGFHTKGYIFNEKGQYNILIGSSNLTANALMKNKEWNVFNTYNNNDEFTKKVLFYFNEYWNESIPAEEYIDEYTKLYMINRENYVIHVGDDVKTLKPNSMQEEFIENFIKFVREDRKRGLLISATGTGKTYAAAFALKRVNAKKILFLVHREQIAKQALETFEKVFDEGTFGLLSGNHKNFSVSYLFSTIQSMSKKDIYTKFKKDEFDYIVIDEVHRAGAPSYQIIMDYFTPKFYLGMSASPDRSDDFDIYSLFYHNIIYEIRLRKALEEEMLCDFHYFGINDSVDANDTSEEHVDILIDNMEYYRYSGDRVKGLVFCNKVETAKSLSQKFNNRGYNTVCLSGSNSQKEREDSIKRLVSDDENCDKLDYIFTVDIFNEGVDIKQLNQIVMLRPTESSIIFIQQLGRGLRKSQNKEYVVILDFISNYSSNYLIPIALSGDRTYNKDMMRKFMFSTSSSYIGNSTVNFDKVAKEKIYKAIDDVSLAKVSFIRDKYKNLKYKLNKILSLMDFYEYGDLDPMFILSYLRSKYGSYPVLLTKLDKNNDLKLSEEELNYLKFLSIKLVNGKRPHELYILKKLIETDKTTLQELNRELDVFLANSNEINISHALTVLDKSFYKSKDQEEFSDVNFFKEKEGTIIIDENFKELLSNNEFKYNINDLIQLGLTQYEDKYKHETKLEDPFKYYEKYSREDVVRLLNFKSNDVATMYGYRTKEDINDNLHCPIFVTYNKKDTISKSTQYEDKFINPQEFSWMTRSGLKLTSKEVLQIINFPENGNKFYLFIKQSDDEGNDFYYMGKVTPSNPIEETIQDDNGKNKPVVNFKLILEKEVRNDIYNYFVN